MTLHRLFIEPREDWSSFGTFGKVKRWRAECSCGFMGHKRAFYWLARREADRHLRAASLLAPETKSPPPKSNAEVGGEET